MSEWMRIWKGLLLFKDPVIKSFYPVINTVNQLRKRIWRTLNGTHKNVGNWFNVVNF